MFHRILPCLPWEMYQVHHKECIYSSSTHKQKLLPFSLEWIPLGSKKCFEIWFCTFIRRNIHVPWKTLHYLLYCCVLLRNANVLAILQWENLITILPMHSGWSNWILGRCYLYECVLICLRYSTTMLLLRWRARWWWKGKTTRQQTSSYEWLHWKSKRR